jgi:hypothetical protein
MTDTVLGVAGYGANVVAVEPTAELRDEGMRLHSSLTIEWVDDHLPTLAGMRQTRHRFDLILLTAVWMHLDESEQRIAMQAITELIAEEGQVILSLRHGPVPIGRRMFEVSAEETIKLGVEFGLRAHHRSWREDMLGRADVSWSFVAFRRS